MRRAVKVAVSLGVTLALALVISFLMISPARAPSGGKLWTGGRTIASLQEEDFDKRLLKLQLCYGIRIDTEQCTLERRRVCKALVAHEMEAALEAPGDPAAAACARSARGGRVVRRSPWGSALPGSALLQQSDTCLVSPLRQQPAERQGPPVQRRWLDPCLFPGL